MSRTFNGSSDKIAANGANVARAQDTLAADSLLFNAVFQYTN